VTHIDSTFRFGYPRCHPFLRKWRGPDCRATGAQENVMAQPKCERRRLSLGRRVISDGLYFARPHYISGGERVMKLADVIAARQAVPSPPSWAAIMTKAFALAAREHPTMRQVFLEFPWGHLGQYDWQVGSVVITRRVDDEDVIFLARLPNPETQSLRELDATLRHYQQTPLEKIGSFRATLRMARLPRLLSRALWWLALHCLPRERVRHFGTFTVSTLSPFGAKSLYVPTLGGPLVHYGAISEQGEIPVHLTIDHRVMDGAVVGFTLLEMEQALRHEIRAELLAMAANANKTNNDQPPGVLSAEGRYTPPLRADARVA
jgi:hypothetical protein